MEIVIRNLERKKTNLKFKFYILVSILSFISPMTSFADSNIERGSYIAMASGCKNCHSIPGNPDYSGGEKLETSFGQLYAPNITPHIHNGIGKWTIQQFSRAVKKGISPKGTPYYPAFPYTHYSLMAKEDLENLYHYFMSLPPANLKSKEHNLYFPFNLRFLLWIWRWLYIEDTSQIVISISKKYERGKYLIEGLGHCGVCHTQRNILGGSISSLNLAGSLYRINNKIITVPNITTHKTMGIGNWDKDDIIWFFKTGLLVDGDTVSGKMGDIIDESISSLSTYDIDSMATYLKSLPPLVNSKFKIIRTIDED